MTYIDVGPYAFPVAVVLLIAVAWFVDLIWSYAVARIVSSYRAWGRIFRRLRR